MRLLTWNVANRIRVQPDQAAAVLSVGADVIALQEVTVNSLPLWRAALTEAGFAHTVCPLDAGRPPKPRRLAVLTAARTPVEPLALALDALPWPERVAACRVGGVDVINVHSPISPSPELAKVRTHEALYAELRDLGGPAVLCGDLNTPRRDLPDGTVLTFAHDTKGRVREERGERWVEAERALVQTLRLGHGWRDPFLEAGPERTWTWPQDRGGWRLDHVLTKGVDATACLYAHEWRLAGLSDHSALLVDLASPATP